jgi:isocitrate/isopropylmalate dehydrogenase
VQSAVAAVLAEGEALPADLGGSASTQQVADAVLGKLG